MERQLIVLVATLMVFVGTGVQGSKHLSFSNSTVDITRDGCGTQKLCLDTPDDCDPAGNGTCLFASVVTGSSAPPNGTLGSFELRGTSGGYVALGLTTNASVGNTLLFICTQNFSAMNVSFIFQTMDLNNNDKTLSPNERTTQNIRGSARGQVYRCEFDVPMLNSSRANTDTVYTILLGNGTVNSTGGIEPFNILLNSGPLNLSDPQANTVTSTTGSSSVVHCQAMLVLLSILSVSLMRA